MTDIANPLDILEFWWKAGPGKWFVVDSNFDKSIITRFGDTHKAACEDQLNNWQHTIEGCFALLILLDQFSRNIYRNDARAFAQDEKALALAEYAISKGYDRGFPDNARAFFYLPYMHSEDIEMQSRCVDLCKTLDGTDNYHFALIHMDVIRRFGRFPHRNALVGRKTTKAEAAFLANGGFSA